MGNMEEWPAAAGNTYVVMAVLANEELERLGNARITFYCPGKSAGESPKAEEGGALGVMARLASDPLPSMTMDILLDYHLENGWISDIIYTHDPKMLEVAPDEGITEKHIVGLANRYLEASRMRLRVMMEIKGYGE